jgi:hypothetical protein
VKLLQGIRDDLAGIRDEVRSTNERLDSLREETNRRFMALEAATVAGFQRLEARFDNLLLGEHGQEHASLRERVARIEAHLELRNE